MKIPCIDPYSRGLKPSASTLLSFQQFQERNRLKRYYLEAVPRLVASVLYFLLWADCPPSLKKLD